MTLAIPLPDLDCPCMQELDEPRCYVPGCGAIDDLEPCFIGEYVCRECKASLRHQRELAGEYLIEGTGL